MTEMGYNNIFDISKSKKVDVVYTFDDAYAEISGVAIVSLLENNREIKSLVIHVVDCGLSESSKRKINKIAFTYNREIKYYKAIDVTERIGMKPESGSWSMVCYVRLFYAEILPSELERALHIDCDTIFRGSILDIYETDLEKFYCAACYDCSPKPKKQAGIDCSVPYISNALILMNLKKWRQDKVGDMFVQYIREHEGKHPHLDQDVLNAVFDKAKRILPAQYNMMPITIMYDKLCCNLFKNQPYYTPEEIKKAVDNPKMIHFVGCRYTRRPWEQPCNHWYNNEWLSYYFTLDYSHTRNLLVEKKRNWIYLKQFIDLFWIHGSSVPILKNLLFWFDCKFLYKL